jgi:CheY-like chemotaxis protein/signal transduction histidine kinase/CHASE3 domain sensor protein
MATPSAGSRTDPRSIPVMPPGQLFSFALAVMAVVLIALFSYRSLESNAEAAERVTRTFEIKDHLNVVLSIVKDAETGQRGYLLTGLEPYLDPYNAAKSSLPGELRALRKLLIDTELQQQRIDLMERLTAEKLAELEQTITLRRTVDAQAALNIVRNDRGKAVMDRIRNLANDMAQAEQRRLIDRQREWQEAGRFSSMVSWVGSAVLLFLIAAAAVVTSRDYRTRERNAWVRAGQMGLADRVQGDQRLDLLGENVLSFLAHYLNAQTGTVYVRQDDGRLHRYAAYALRPGRGAEFVGPGEGLLGQAVKERRPLRVSEVPADYLTIGSSVGNGAPLELLVAPAIVDGTVHAVIELGFFRKLDATDLALLDRVSETLGVAVRSSKDRTRLEQLLEETQQQAEELQAQQEELRVGNEELEEQSRVLKESQAQLESQHAELEQTNVRLEEQTQMLELQRDTLARAQIDLTEKASELESSNHYKSEFLANMSHELRTPLNSTLILAKLLADNKDGNLSDEQVKFAQTISSAGNDLLALINDILDLSKIEAGKVEVSAEPVAVQSAIDLLMRTLQPMATQKGLGFTSQVAPNAPEHLVTDPRRLGQILRNLLSNALKFTEHGEVSLQVARESGDRVSFAVRDTGIGIDGAQQGLIFDAFRQADGSTHRKYGGTGLGLSISRQLAKLLGGDIAVQSTPGEGSSFTLTLPLKHSFAPAEADAPWQSAPLPEPRAAVSFDAQLSHTSRPARPSPATGVNTQPAARALSPMSTEDDRSHLNPESRLILVVEDDAPFSAILRDLVREMGFQCVVTHSAGDGLAAATAFRPSAILLDMNLPDHSGLGVLDQLKRNPLTRHVPVHVISVADYTQEALELGAIGYALKPVKREQLVDALQRLEAKFSQGLRRVLVVEDDERQRDSMSQLLGNGEVQIVGVESATEALAQLKATTFDCMVMDLNLPDLSGYELLEKMSKQEDMAFPPVIVYTGRALTRDEEHDLQRFSRSIIIKDARSPERLLDEVTLFLHQVESKLPPERQRMLKAARDRDATLEGRRILVVEDDARNIFALSSVLEPKGVKVDIARNGREALEQLAKPVPHGSTPIDLVLMDIMMPEMDGLTAMREIRKKPEWKKLPIIALTAKAMKDDQEKCLAAGANDYIAKPLDVDKLLSLVRVWMPK